MKEIFREYGTALIAIFSGILILVLLFGISYGDKMGFLSVAGTVLDQDERDYTEYMDFDAVVEWNKRAKPEVNYDTECGRYFVGDSIDFLKRYYVKDAEGNVYYMDQVLLFESYPDIIFAEICDIRDMGGRSILDKYNSQTGHIMFEESGVFDVYFRVIDKENLEETWKIPIVVDERR